MVLLGQHNVKKCYSIVVFNNFQRKDEKMSSKEMIKVQPFENVLGSVVSCKMNWWQNIKHKFWVPLRNITSFYRAKVCTKVIHVEHHKVRQPVISVLNKNNIKH